MTTLFMTTLTSVLIGIMVRGKPSPLIAIVGVFFQLVSVSIRVSNSTAYSVHDHDYYDGENIVCEDVMSECTSEFPINRSTWNLIQQLREIYEDYPITCLQREDVCRPDVTSLPRKGNISWPDTSAGSMRYKLCPYAYQKAVYAHRQCVLQLTADDVPESVWGAVAMSQCPDPPFSIGLKEITTHVASQESMDESSCKGVIYRLGSLLSLRKSRPNDPIFDTDYSNLTHVCLAWSSGCAFLKEHEADPSDFVEDLVTLWNASDLLLNDSYVKTWNAQDNAKFILYMTWLFPNVSKYTMQPFSFNGSNVHAISGAPERSSRIHLQLPAQATTNHSYANIDATLSQSAGSYIESYSVFVIPTTKNIPAMKEAILSQTEPTESVYTEIPFSSSSPVQQTNTKLTPPSYKYVIVGPLSMTSSYRFPTVHCYVIVGPVVFVDFNVDPDEETEMSTDVGGSTTDGFEEHQETTEAALIYTTQPTTRQSIQIMLEFHHQYQVVDPKSVLCAGSPFTRSSPLPGWYNPDSLKFFTDVCSLVEATKYVTKCKCSKRGIFAVFVKENKINWLFPLAPTPDNNPSTISTFLGFRYIEQLYIAGAVLKAVSLFCLLATILTHICLRVSLIVLLIVTQITEYLAGTKIGCRISNVFRYYWILVSLLWNGVEAHNMYRMLIKVFNVDTSHFVLKAGIVSYLVPAVAIGCAMTASRQAFDGAVVDCAFRCSLKKTTLYYAWLLPMATIIVHNLIVFALVVKVLCNPHRPGTLNNPESNAKGHWTRLCGACTMLALLGIPWIFSAFAAIDLKANANTSVEVIGTVFNVIFVVGFSIQGLFIFWFHCARIPTVRRNWIKSVVNCSTRLVDWSRTLTSDASSTSNKATSNTSWSARVASFDSGDDKQTDKSMKTFNPLNTTDPCGNYDSSSL